MEKSAYDYKLFMLANKEMCFHPGGVMASLGLISKVPGIDKNKTVILDYGCGNGLTLATLARFGFKNLIGFDHNEELIAQKNQSDELKILNIRFFSHYEEMIANVKKADVMIIESVCSYMEDEMFTTIVNEMTYRLGIKYLGINDFYQFSPKNETLHNIISSVFGVKKVRDKSELLALFNNIKRTSEPKIVLDQLYVMDDKLVLDPNQMTANLINLYPAKKIEEESLKKYFTNYVNDMNQAFRLFKTNFNYLSVLIKT